MVNARPRLNLYQRELACHRVRVEGWSVIAAAHAAGVSRQTVHKWLRRVAHEGPVGLADRSSRPQRMPRLTRIDLAVRICSELIRVRPNGTRETLLDSLIAPGGLAFAPDGSIYITNKSVFAGGGESCASFRDPPPLIPFRAVASRDASQTRDLNQIDRADSARSLPAR